VPTLPPADGDRASAAAFDHVFMSRKSCEKCTQEFLIVDGVPMTEDQFRRKGKA
jgi:hypothetical protein